MKVLLALLVIANLLLYGWFHGWLSPYGGEGRDPQRMARQVMPERLRIVSTGTPGQGQESSAQGGSRTAPGSDPSAAGPEAPSAQGGSGALSGSNLLPMPPESPSDSALQASSPPANWPASGCVELAPLTEAQILTVQSALDDQPYFFTTLLPAGIETWWVYVWPPQGEAQARLEALRARKLVDEVVQIREGVMRGAIVLGRFREPNNALALQRRTILAGETHVRIAARGGPPATSVLRIQVADADALKRAAGEGSGPLILARMPFSESGVRLIERQRETLVATGATAVLRACPADQATAFSSRR